MDVFVELRFSARRWNFPLEKNVHELNLMARNVACCIVMHVCLAQEIARARLDTSPKRESTSLNVKFLR